VGAFDVEGTRAVSNDPRVVDVVAELVVEVGVIAKVSGIDARDIVDVQDAVGLADRIRGQEVGNAHSYRIGYVRAFIPHAIPGFFDAGAGSKVCEVILTKAVVHRHFAVAGKDHSQSDCSDQNQRKQRHQQRDSSFRFFVPGLRHGLVLQFRNGRLGVHDQLAALRIPLRASYVEIDLDCIDILNCCAVIFEIDSCPNRNGVPTGVEIGKDSLHHAGWVDDVLDFGVILRSRLAGDWIARNL